VLISHDQKTSLSKSHDPLSVHISGLKNLSLGCHNKELSPLKLHNHKPFSWFNTFEIHCYVQIFLLVVYSTTLPIYTQYIASNGRIMNWKGFGRTRSWRNRGTISEFARRYPRKSSETPIKNNRRCSNREAHESHTVV
jgi:hypothetical protein